MKSFFLSLLFCSLSCCASLPPAADKILDTKNPPEKASVADLSVSSPTSAGDIRSKWARAASLDNPTLRAGIEPPRRITLIQDRLPDNPFTIEKRWYFEFPLTPMRSTGYWVDQGETLDIRLQVTGTAPSQLPSVWVHSLDDNTFAYSTTQKIRLRQGITTIVASKKGAVYIAVENPPINGVMTVELVSGGRPMPRFLLGGHTAADWDSMLNSYGSAPYAELIGRRAMMTLTLERARRFVDDPVKMLAQWDKLIAFGEAQFDLSRTSPAPHDSPRFPYHFVECEDCKDVYMYAWTYRAAFYNDQISKVVNPHLMETDGWGPWHEFGHVIQHDDLTADYERDAETVVNLTSLWVQTEFFGQKSELETGGVWTEIQNYLARSSKNWNNLDDVWVRLGMYWQLRLAFGPTFYARYVAASRRLAGYPGTARKEKEARVVIETSRVAGRNLIPFYEKWGMPITAATRQAVQNLQLPPLDKPIWDNTDMSAPHTYYGPGDQLPPIGEVIVPLDGVHSGDRFSVVADFSSHSGHTLSYQWYPGQFENPQGATTNTLVITAPRVQVATAMNVTVTIAGALGPRVFTSSVMVKPPLADEGPVARITGPSSVEAGKTLTLSASDSTGSGLRYAWDARGFSPASAAAVEPSFTAPDSAGQHAINLTVTDSQNRPATAIHPISVTAPPSGCDYRDPAAEGVSSWSSQSYAAGTQVSYQHVVWEAKYVTSAAPPAVSDDWKIISTIPVPWSALRAYDEDGQVHHQDNVYRTPWWIKGTAPPTPPWALVGPCQ